MKFIIAGRGGNAGHLPAGVDGKGKTTCAPERAEVPHGRAVPEEGVLFTVGGGGTAGHLPRVVNVKATTKCTPERTEVLQRGAIPQERVPGIKVVAGRVGKSCHLPGGVD